MLQGQPALPDAQSHGVVIALTPTQATADVKAGGVPVAPLAIAGVTVAEALSAK